MSTLSSDQIVVAVLLFNCRPGKHVTHVTWPYLRSQVFSRNLKYKAQTSPGFELSSQWSSKLTSLAHVNLLSITGKFNMHWQEDVSIIFALQHIGNMDEIKFILFLNLVSMTNIIHIFEKLSMLFFIITAAANIVFYHCSQCPAISNTVI